MNARLPHVERAGLADWLPFGAEADSPAEQFAAWLPYSAYLADEKLFVNRDGLGFLLKLMPQSGADERMAEVLVSLYATCPPGTGVQFHLFASPHIREQLCRYANLRVEDTDQAEKAKHWGRLVLNDNLFNRPARPARRPFSCGRPAWCVRWRARVRLLPGVLARRAGLLSCV